MAKLRLVCYDPGEGSPLPAWCTIQVFLAGTVRGGFVRLSRACQGLSLVQGVTRRLGVLGPVSMSVSGS